ncbi:MAG: cell division protein FtsQ/DivIB, partial [Thermodesulfobacteriota bacterium]
MTKKNLNPLHTFILLIFILSFCSLIVLIVLHLGIFNLKEIEIEGVRKITKKEILIRSGLRRGISTIFFRENIVKSEIQKNPWISGVRIKRILPNKVVIQVTEADPFWLLTGDDGELFYMSEMGKILGKANFDEGLDFPVLIGEGIYNSHLLGKALEIRRLSDNSKVLTLKEISEIHLDSIYGISVFTLDKRRIDFGSDNISEKWYKMEKIIKYTRKINLTEEYINISSEKRGIIDFKL